MQDLLSLSSRCAVVCSSGSRCDDACYLLGDCLGNFIRRQTVGAHIDVGVLPSVPEPSRQLFPPCGARVTGSSPQRQTPRNIDKHEYIRISEPLPHIGYEGVLLTHLAHVIPIGLQDTHKRRLTCSAWTDDGNEWVLT